METPPRFLCSVCGQGHALGFTSLLDDRDFPKGFERTSLMPLHRLYVAGHTVPSARRFIPQSDFLAVGARLLAF